MSTIAYGAHAADRKLESMAIQRRAVGAADVRIDIAYCGLCHSDIHQARSEWAGTKYPCVPGHEIVGRVAEVGSAVTSFKAGDLVGVGCIVDSCRHCAECNDGLENYCDRMVGTYNGATPDAPGHTLGGYSQHIVVDQRYVLRVRHAEAQLPAVAPLLCAGITTWSPLRHWGVKAGVRVGIVGIGGLGHMGVKLANALGAEVVAFTTSESKRAAAMALGAHEVVVSRDPDAMAQAYTEDAKVLPPDAPVVEGRAAIRTFFRNLFEARPEPAAFDERELEVLGKYTWRLGIYSLPLPDGTVEYGKFIQLWKLEKGEWKLYRSMWSPNGPPVPAMAAPAVMRGLSEE